MTEDAKMNDYMTSLFYHYAIKSPNEEKLNEDITATISEIRKAIPETTCKELFRLQNQYDSLQDETNIYAFISGFRLAEGIHSELNAIPQFSLAKESEANARRIFEIAHRLIET